MQSYFQHLQCNILHRSFTCEWTGHTYTVQSAVASHVRSEQDASACYSDQCHKHAQSVDLQQVYLVVYCDVIFSKMKHAMSTSQGYYTLFPCFTSCSTLLHAKVTTSHLATLSRCLVTYYTLFKDITHPPKLPSLHIASCHIRHCAP